MRRSFFMFDSRYGFIIAAMLLVMGLRAESHAGKHLQGKHLQGKHLQGKHLQGKHLQGKHLQGKHLQGRALGDTRGAAGFTLHGAAWMTRTRRPMGARDQGAWLDLDTCRRSEQATPAAGEPVLADVHGRPRHAR